MIRGTDGGWELGAGVQVIGGKYHRTNADEVVEDGRGGAILRANCERYDEGRAENGGRLEIAERRESGILVDAETTGDEGGRPYGSRPASVIGENTRPER
jgi:hypothetical protein